MAGGRHHDERLEGPTHPVAAAALPLLLCQVGTRVCALPLDHVVETMRPLPCVELTDSPEFILGVAIIRGRPVPVIDAHVVLGGDPEASGRYVTLAIDGRLVALAVDEVLEVQEIDPMELDLLPPLLAGSTDGRDPITLLGELDAHVLAVLSAGRLLASGDDGWLGRVAIPTIESDVS